MARVEAERAAVERASAVVREGVVLVVLLVAVESEAAWGQLAETEVDAAWAKGEAAARRAEAHTRAGGARQLHWWRRCTPKGRMTNHAGNTRRLLHNSLSCICHHASCTAPSTPDPYSVPGLEARLAARVVALAVLCVHLSCRLDATRTPRSSRSSCLVAQRNHQRLSRCARGLHS